MSEKNLNNITEILDSLSEGIVIVDWKGKVLFLNKALVKIAALKGKKEALGENAAMFLHPDYRLKMVKDIFKFKKTRGGYISEYKILNRKREYIWAELVGSPINFQGSDRILLTVRDITENKENKLLIEKNEKLYENVLNTVPYGVAEIDINGKYFYVNDSYYKILGYKPKEVVGKDISLFLKSRKDFLELKKYLHKIAKDNSNSKPWFGKNLTKKGEEIDIKIDWRRKKDKDGKTIGFFIVVTDITKEKKNEEELKREKESYRYLYENSLDLLINATLTGKIIDINERWLKLLGYKKKEIIGQNFTKFVSLKDAAIMLKDMAVELAGGETYPRIIEVKTKKGKKVLVEMASGSVPLYDESKKLIGVMASGRDISKEKQVEEALRASEKKHSILFNRLLDGLVYLEAVYNKKGKMVDSVYIDMNSAYEKFTNKKRDEIIRKKVSEVMPGTTQSWFDKFDVVMKTGKPVFFEMYHESTKKFYSVSAYKQDEESYAAFFSDITDRKNKEKLLQIQRDLGVAFGVTTSLGQATDIFLQKLKEIEEVDCGGLYLFDEENNLNLIKSKGTSSSFIKMSSHFSPNDQQTKLVKKGKPIFKKYQDLENLKNKNKAFEKIKALAVLPLKNQKKVIGSLNIGSHTYENFSNDTKNLLQTIASQIEGTVIRIQTEKEIESSEEKYRYLAETQSEGMVLLNKKCVVDYANPALEKLTGYSRQELIGKHFSEFFIDESTVAAQKVCRDLFHGKVNSTSNNKYQVYKKDRTIITVEISSSPIMRGGKLVGLQSTIRDITARQKAEDELKDKVNELERINNLMVGRELKMIELKRKLADLEKKLEV